jgi:hypothetical protein
MLYYCKNYKENDHGCQVIWTIGRWNPISPFQRDENVRFWREQKRSGIKVPALDKGRRKGVY